MLLAWVPAGSTVLSDTVGEAFPPPDGYRRIEVSPGSFGAYLRRLEVLPDTARIRYYNGAINGNWDRGYRVLNLPFLFQQDLEQCADVAYRLYCEFLRSVGLDSLIVFRLQNGQKLSWLEWSGGTRLEYDPSRDRHRVVASEPDTSRTSFNDFLYYLFYWAGSAAMKSYLHPVAEGRDLRVGDLIVQNVTGAMGHVSIILDICRNADSDWLYLIANGWTPAQTPFVRMPESGQGIGYWFTLAGYEEHLRPYNFGPFLYRRF